MTELQRALKLTEEIQRDYVDVTPVQTLKDILQILTLKESVLHATIKEHFARSHDPKIDVRILLRLVE